MGKIISSTLLGLFIIANASSILAAKEKNSAHLIITNLEEFYQSRSAAASINQREIDPFGKHQKPQKVVKVRAFVQQTDLAKKEQKILIQQEISKLGKKLNVLGRSIIIDGQPYKRKDTINVKVKGKTFPLRVNSITRRRITFLDLSDNNLISLDLKNGRFIPRSDEEITMPSGNHKTHNLE